MFQFFPFTNAHQLNLDWILETLKTFPRTVNNTYPDEDGNINLPTVAGMSSWNGIGADGAGNVNPLEDISDLDNAKLNLHFYHWTNPSTAHNPYDANNMISQEGFCISYQNFGGYIVQIAWGSGGDVFAVRSLNYGYPWSSWKYINSILNLSPYLILDATNIDTNQPFSYYAYQVNGWCFGYVAGVSTGILSGNAKIMEGLPVPLCDPIPYQFIGMVELLPNVELRPCKFQINSNGELTFSFVGNTEEAGDYVYCSFAYPVK